VTTGTPVPVNYAALEEEYALSGISTPFTANPYATDPYATNPYGGIGTGGGLGVSEFGGLGMSTNPFVEAVEMRTQAIESQGPGVGTPGSQAITPFKMNNHGGNGSGSGGGSGSGS